VELLGRGIAPAQETAAVTLSLDVAEPWGGGMIQGRLAAVRWRLEARRSRAIGS
jgi:hypothetical protein